MVAMLSSPSRRVSMTSETPLQIAFLDVETTIPAKKGDGYELLEFAAVVLAAEGFYEVFSFSTLVCPSDLGRITPRSVACNGITPEKCAGAPRFGEVSEQIYRILHGRVWAGHNIVKFDNLRIREAFERCNQTAPEPLGVIDTLPLLRSKFGLRAGNLKMARLGEYCGLGKQEHRSLEDCRMNIEILKHCAAMLFLEANFADIFSPSTLASVSALHSSSASSPLSSSEHAKPVGTRGRPPRNGERTPSTSNPQSGEEPPSDSGVSAVQAVSTAAFLHALDKSSQTHPQAGRPPTDALITSLAALSLVGGDPFPGGGNQRTAQGHNPVAGVFNGTFLEGTGSFLEGAQLPRTPGNDPPGPSQSPYGSQSGLAKDVLPQVKNPPTLRRGLSLDSGLPVAYVPRSPSQTGGPALQRKRHPQEGAGQSGGEEMQRRDPPEGGASQLRDSEPQWKGPQEEERLRYMGENESADKVVNWLNQVPSAEVWAEPDEHGPDLSDSPAVGRPGVSGVVESEEYRGGLESDSTFEKRRQGVQEIGFSNESSERAAETRTLDEKGRSRGALDTSEGSHTREGGNIREGVHSNGVVENENDRQARFLEIANAAASQELPDEEEASQQWSYGSRNGNAVSRGNYAKRLSALAEADEVSLDLNGSGRQPSIAGYRDNPPGLAHEDDDRYGHEDTTAGEPLLDEPEPPPTPDFQPKRKGFCFPLQKLVGMGKPDRVSANPGAKRLPAPHHEAAENQSGPATFRSARESSLDPLSQSYGEFTEGGEDGFATGRSSPASTSTMGMDAGVRDSGTYRETSFYGPSPVFDPLAIPLQSPSRRITSAHMAIDLPPTGYPPSRRSSYDPPSSKLSSSGLQGIPLSPAFEPRAGGDRYFVPRPSPRRSPVADVSRGPEGSPPVDFAKRGPLGHVFLPPDENSPAETLRGPYFETSSSDVASSWTGGEGGATSRRKGGGKGSPVYPAYPPREVNVDSLRIMESFHAIGPPSLALHLGDTPLQVQERQMRLRFSVGDAFAYDAHGRPTFSVVGEPSAELRNFLEGCDVMLRQQLGPRAGFATWRRTIMQKDGDVDTIRIRIGAKGYQQTATYTTKFLRRKRSGKGIERLPLGVVDPLIFRSFFPHGCTVDVVFSIETYSIDGYAGCRLVASELTLV